MGRIFKKPYWVKDKTTGEKVRKESKRYYVEYRDEHGKKRREVAATDKTVSNRLLVKREQEVERRKCGEVNHYKEHQKTLLVDHITDFEKHLRSKGDSEDHVEQTIGRLKKIIDDCKMVRISDLQRSPVENFIYELNQSGQGPQTCNFYLQAINHFVNWLVTDCRMSENPIRSIQKMNVRKDRRHDRRPLSLEEMAYLIEEARNGQPVEGMSGIDRAMLYLFCQMTGCRRKEAGSVTLSDLNLDPDSPAVMLRAGHTKNGRDAEIPLHPELARELKLWLSGRQTDPRQPIFDLRTPKNELRKTSKMIKKDLEKAKKRWVESASSEDERQVRRQSDFLEYRNQAGLYADFHSLRHAFVSNLAQGDVHPKTAQLLARHGSIELTMNRYTHVAKAEKSLAISKLPIVGGLARPEKVEKAPSMVSKMDPCGVRFGPLPGTSADFERHHLALNQGEEDAQEEGADGLSNSLTDRVLDTACHQMTSPGTMAGRVKSEVHPEGFEPPTPGSEDRCSIQLSYGCNLIPVPDLRQ